MTKKQIKESNLIIALFDGWSNSGKKGNLTNLYCKNEIYLHKDDIKYHSSWDWLMAVVDKIEEIGASMEIRPHHSSIHWWYSPKKTITYSKGAGGGGGHTENRKPFDYIGGKHYSRYVGVGETAEKFNVPTKIEAVYSNVVYFIEWYNKNVKK
ncbi:MAG: hypothetical protein IPJ01_10600 [Micavibrio sp.]|nr:hypothetical protein [Micavibrio sp.]